MLHCHLSIHLIGTKGSPIVRVANSVQYHRNKGISCTEYTQFGSGEHIDPLLTHVAYLPMELWPVILKPCRLLYQVSVDECFLDHMGDLQVLTEYCMSSGEAGFTEDIRD